MPAVRRACREHRCLAGTIDAWLIWNLTGGPNGGQHVTDVTNASRTLLMNIETLHWDPVLTRTFGIRTEMLPSIRSSSEIIGPVRNGSVLDGIPISGVLANQQASLVGQMCVKRGQTKNTYRSGCFLLCNTGEEKVLSAHGLLTTIAYKMGPKAPPVYALEGSVAIAGAALRWLQTNLRVMDSQEESEHVSVAARTDKLNQTNIFNCFFVHTSNNRNSWPTVCSPLATCTLCPPSPACTRRTGARMRAASFAA